MLTASMRKRVAIGLMLVGGVAGLAGAQAARNAFRSTATLVRLGNGDARPFAGSPVPAPTRPWSLATFIVITVPIVVGFTKFTRPRRRSSGDTPQPRQPRHLRHPRGRPSRTRLENFQPTAAPKSSGLASPAPR